MLKKSNFFYFGFLFFLFSFNLLESKVSFKRISSNFKLKIDPILASIISAAAWQFFDTDINGESFRYRIKKGPLGLLESEINNFRLDVLLDSLVIPVTSEIYQNFLESKGILTSDQIEDLMGIYESTFSFFIKVLERGKGTFEFFKDKFFKLPTKMKKFCLIYGFLSSGLNHKVLNMIDERYEDDNIKNSQLKKLTEKVLYFGIKDLFLKKIFDLVFSASISILDDRAEIDDQEKLKDLNDACENIKVGSDILISGLDVYSTLV